jgi:molybdopterin-guanine dinucleotide biosynthesis protein
MTIIGISGLARSGKDTLFKFLSEKLKINNISSKRLAFADELKEECDDFLKKNIDISAFTEKNEEKEIIRPFLVCYGTKVRRRLNKNCWIDRLSSKLEATNQDYVFITDVRYENEIEWVKSQGGKTIHIERHGNIAPNKEELRNDPILKNSSQYRVKWKNFKETDNLYINNKVNSIYNELFQ